MQIYFPSCESTWDSWVLLLCNNPTLGDFLHFQGWSMEQFGGVCHCHPLCLAKGKTTNFFPQNWHKRCLRAPFMMMEDESPIMWNWQELSFDACLVGVLKEEHTWKCIMLFWKEISNMLARFKKNMKLGRKWTWMAALESRLPKRERSEG